jgi:hypothetical protein
MACVAVGADCGRSEEDPNTPFEAISAARS